MTWSTASRRDRRPIWPSGCKAASGWDDHAPVMAESFIQWVIEDHFIAGRPAWESVGVEMVESVLPHEEAKIRSAQRQPQLHRLGRHAAPT